jgi:hypothetical protein
MRTSRQEVEEARVVLETALRHNESLTFVETLISDDLLCTPNLWGRTPLHVAVDCEVIPRATFLVVCAEAVIMLDVDGWNPLHIACLRHDQTPYPVIKLMVETCPEA